MERIRKSLRAVPGDVYAFALIFLALLLRASFFGFEYYYQLDDYIHFRQLAEGTDVIQLCIDGGYFSSRPMAVLFDFLIWSPMDHYVAVAVICAMYAGAAVLYWKVFRRHFGTGWFFVIFFTLLPLGFEGTYWLAASTRVVPPLLFSALALWCLDRFVEKRNYWLLPVFVVSTMASFVLYEQLLVLSLALSLMLMLLHLMKKRRHALWALLVFVPVAAYVAFTGHFSAADSSLGSRMEIILPWQEGYFDSFLPSLLTQMRMAFVEGGKLTLTKGLRRGVELIFSEGVWAAALIPVLGAAIFRAAAKAKGSRGESDLWALVFGFLAALAPLTPFFIIASPWFSLRNTVPSFLGLALLLDWLLRKFTRNHTAVLTSVFACVCLVASVSELYDYRMTTTGNEQVVRAVMLADETYDLHGKVGILGLNDSYLEDQNFKYHDHILSAHASDWALVGALRYFDGNAATDYTPTPLPTNGAVFWNAWNRTVRDVTQYDQLLLYDHEAQTMELLTLVPGEEEQLLYFSDGTLCARIFSDEQGYGHIEFAE